MEKHIGSIILGNDVVKLVEPIDIEIPDKYLINNGMQLTNEGKDYLVIHIIAHLNDKIKVLKGNDK